MMQPLAPIVVLSILLLLASYACAQSCLPALNDGGVLDFWEIQPGGRLVVQSEALQELHVVEHNDHITGAAANEIDILSPTNKLRITVEPFGEQRGARLTLKYKCELPEGTQVADYYSAGVKLHEVTTHLPIAQEFVARHSGGYLLHLNLGVVGFTGRIRIFKGRLDNGCPELLHEESSISIPTNGVFGEHPNVADGSPTQTQGIWGANLQLIRLSKAIYMEGGEEYIVEVVPDKFTSMKVHFTSSTGEDVKHNLHEVGSGLVVGMELVTFIPGLLKREDVTLSMAESITSVLDRDSMMNQPSVSIQQGTSTLLFLQAPSHGSISSVVVQKARGIIHVSLQQEGSDRWRLAISGLQRGIDTIEIYSSGGLTLLSMVTVYVAAPVAVSASLQYITESNWPNPNGFYDDWDHNPTSALEEVARLTKHVFGPVGIIFSFQNHGLIPIAGLDANGDQQMSDFAEWTNTPLMTESDHRHYPLNFNNFGINIYAVRKWADYERTGQSNGGGTSRVIPAGESLACGAFVKTWKNRDPASIASTLLHEVGHCLSLAHNEEWNNYAAMDLSNSATRQNVMAVGRSEDHRLSPRQWLAVREYARLQGTGQTTQSTFHGDCWCDAGHPCVGSTGTCFGTGNAADYADPTSGLERCSATICLGSRRYSDSDQLREEAKRQDTLCASTYTGSPLPNVCYGSTLSLPVVTPAPTERPTETPSPLPSTLPSRVASTWPTQAPTTSAPVATGVPSGTPTQSSKPSVGASSAPSLSWPSMSPSSNPTFASSDSPSSVVSVSPTDTESVEPSATISIKPSNSWPSALPSISPTLLPSEAPASEASIAPTYTESSRPSANVSNEPSISWPSMLPSSGPTIHHPSYTPSLDPSYTPKYAIPTDHPTTTSPKPSLSPSSAPKYAMPTDHPAIPTIPSLTSNTPKYANHPSVSFLYVRDPLQR